MENRFLQIHYLSSYPGTLLNRDEAGFAKRIVFGGVSRTRISSQCLKRHWRTHEGEYSLKDIGIPMSTRSRQIFEKFIVEPLLLEFSPEKVRLITEALMSAVLGKSEKKSEKPKKNEDERNSQNELECKAVVVLGKVEIDYLLNLTRTLCNTLDNPKKSKDVENAIPKELKNNLKALGKAAAGLDGVLFGRMVTSDLLARVDAAIHVAHAFTVHGEASENDYFSVVDDLVQLGSGHINNTELTTGLYYGYVVIDIPLLFSNLEGYSFDVVAKVIENLIHLIARVSPGAKLGSTAPYAYAHLLMAEMGNGQPCTFANAFLKPVKDQPDLLNNTYNALTRHIKELDAMYATQNRRGVACMGEMAQVDALANLQEFQGIKELTTWVVDSLRGHE
ncbi:hypothetical protein PNK_1126 [Candidatus Protochlamydia naegleriophila]|uniref:Type I-E CRISPR-associated protein Cas7/Cse4/CasC n=1 Tax=Candidatus Protochlamydia naegleriophila TaxID=389348 RepID=A0A0U5JC86_9BACT|nr:type I-E CRISPR-associated protein Cas7/Cse4/CasC [Candidatus Protochlamydia naegleriophila]CUI16743.1 hypothetical protein PNK_1126 [Candidatus Protochlamydia naegleriophila]